MHDQGTVEVEEMPEPAKLAQALTAPFIFSLPKSHPFLAARVFPFPWQSYFSLAAAVGSRSLPRLGL